MSPFLKMLMKVSAKMKDKLDYIIPYDKMQFIWVTDFFDLPTKGLCKLNNELHVFEIINWEDDNPCYSVFKLSFFEKVKWLLRKKCFELCIGKHWTYPNRKNGVRFYTGKPKWFWKLMFNLYYWRKFKWNSQ